MLTVSACGQGARSTVIAISPHLYVTTYQLPANQQEEQPVMRVSALATSNGASAWHVDTTDVVTGK
ncbi:MAG: hypothetical protein ABI068_04260 [Ktedonobacterales bacterium]